MKSLFNAIYNYNRVLHGVENTKIGELSLDIHLPSLNDITNVIERLNEIICTTSSIRSQITSPGYIL